MSSIQLLRVLVNERLSAAADEIFEAVKKTISDYEEELLLSKQELHRQRRMLQVVAEPPGSPGGHSEEPQLTLCVWDEDFTSDHQQKEEPNELEWSLDTNRNPCSPGGRSQELEDSSIIKVNFMPPFVRNVGSSTEFSEAMVKEEEEEPLPSTSTQPDAADGASTSCSDADSEEEWKANSQSKGKRSSKKKKKKRVAMLKIKLPRRPVAPKLNPTKKNKTQICCKVCGRAFLLAVSLVNHMEAHSKDVCGVCGERFDSEECFDAHLKTHVKAESCKVCGKCFSSSSGLEVHMRIHTGEKPFVCSECGKCFTTRANMLRHSRIHTGEKPYTCTVCGRSFNDYTTLKRHLFVHSVKNSSLARGTRRSSAACAGITSTPQRAWQIIWTPTRTGRCARCAGSVSTRRATWRST
uniref:Oocyte zinc finger protein XlCOF6-like n=1 Tax=Poecilia reticulata TaxID=8081 RepID=A0A3P9PEE9_POERE